MTILRHLMAVEVPYQTIEGTNQLDLSSLPERMQGWLAIKCGGDMPCDYRELAIALEGDLCDDTRAVYLACDVATASGEQSQEELMRAAALSVQARALRLGLEGFEVKFLRATDKPPLKAPPETK